MAGHCGSHNIKFALNVVLASILKTTAARLARVTPPLQPKNTFIRKPGILSVKSLEIKKSDISDK